MKRNLIIILFLVLNSVVLSQNKSELKLNDAENLISTQNYNDANDLIDNVLENDKSNHRAYYLRSKISLEIGNLKGAISEISLALKYDETNDFYYSKRGEIYFSEKKYTKAFEDFNQAYLLNNSELRYLLRKSISEYYLEKNDDALLDIQNYLKQNADDDLANYYCALILTKTEKFMESLEFVNKSIEKNTSNSEYYLLRANIYLKTNKFELADNDYGMVLDLNPNFAEAYFNRATLRIKQGNADGACSDWQKAINLKYYKADEFLKKYCSSNNKK